MSENAVENSTQKAEASTSRRKRNNRPRNRKKPDQPNGDQTIEGAETSAKKSDRASTLQEPEAGGEKRPSDNSENTSTSKQPRNRTKRPIVARPKPKSTNIREAELSQVIRMYKPEKVNDELFKLSLKPSDPDFAFDIELLQLDLHLPLEYPTKGPWIKVTNKDIPVGYAANVDLGFSNEIVAQRLGKGRLIDMLIELDKRLEAFLKQEKQGTIKIVKGKKKASATTTTATKTASASASTVGSNYSPSAAVPAVLRRALLNKKMFVPAYIAAERDNQIRLLQNRLKDKIALFSSTDAGKAFRVDIVPHAKDSEILIPEFMGQFNVRLFVPNEYPLAPCTITIPSIQDISARNVEKNFNVHAEQEKNLWTLLALLNYLSVNLESLILPPETFEHMQREPVIETSADSLKKQQVDVKAEDDASSTLVAEIDKLAVDVESEGEGEGEGEVEKRESASATGLDTPSGNAENPGDIEEPSSVSVARRGLELSFDIEQIKGIAFYECLSLSIQVECSRCQTTNDMVDMVSAAYGKESKPRHVNCKKCQFELVGAFRKDILHPNNSIAGYIDLVDCHATDYLPSNFTFTCEKCTETHQQPLKVGLGKSVSVNCYHCHEQMFLKFATFKFSQMSSNGLRLRKLASEASQKLKLSRGTPLPNGGACVHYKKSQRWFRFSCCQKAFACEKCHDTEQGQTHTADTPYRMICGTCSFEQNLAQVCKFCQHSFEIRHSAFWEGGKGTRNKTTMSRKDPRKYKRLPGNKKSTKKKESE